MAGLDLDNCTFCPSQNWRKACGHMGTLGIYSFQARQQCIRCWISWGRQALSWDNLIITSLSVFFKSFFSEDQASCLVEVDEIQLDMKMKVHDGEVIEVGRDVPLGANPTNPALYRNFRLVLKEVIWKRWWCRSSVSINCVFSSIKVISARCSTLVINWGHQQGYSTRVIN